MSTVREEISILFFPFFVIPRETNNVSLSSATARLEMINHKKRPTTHRQTHVLTSLLVCRCLYDGGSYTINVQTYGRRQQITGATWKRFLFLPIFFFNEILFLPFFFCSYLSTGRANKNG